MNDRRIYNDLIMRGWRRTAIEGYYEKHHIIPRCLNGSNDKDNLVLLTAREHYLCHWLLWKSIIIILCFLHIIKWFIKSDHFKKETLK